MHLLSKRSRNAPLILAAHYRIRGNHKKLFRQRSLSKNNVLRFRDYLAQRIKVGTGSLLVRRSVVEKIQYSEKVRRMEDAPFLSQAFGLFETYCVQEPTVLIHAHETSKRHETENLIEESDLLIEEVFNPKIITPEMMVLKDWYRSFHYLDIFRVLFRNDQHDAAKRFYHRAINNRPSCIFRWMDFKKYVRT